MSATIFDHDYLPDAGATTKARPISARPLGTLAALMMGVAALSILGITRAFVALPPTPAVDEALAPAAEQQSAATAHAGPQKRTDKVMQIEAPQSLTATDAFDLAAPEFAAEKKVVTGRALESTGGREDNLTYGEFALGGPYLRLDIRQTGSEKPASTDFYLDITRHAREAGLSVKKINAPSPVATRFGTFQVADIRLTGPQTDGGLAPERNCVAARTINAAAGVEIAGIACGSAGKPIEKASMGCLLDKLDYHSDGAGPETQQFFASGEGAKGQACAAATADAKTAAGGRHGRGRHKAR